MEDLETHGHHEQFGFCCGYFANASQFFLLVPFPKAPPRNAITYSPFPRTYIAQEAQRPYPASDVASNVHDESLNAAVFQVANSGIQTVSETLAYSSGKCRYF